MHLEIKSGFRLGMRGPDSPMAIQNNQTTLKSRGNSLNDRQHLTMMATSRGQQDLTLGVLDSIDLGEHSQDISKEKFSIDVSHIENNSTKGMHDSVYKNIKNISKDTSQFGGNLHEDLASMKSI